MRERINKPKQRGRVPTVNLLHVLQLVRYTLRYTAKWAISEPTSQTQSPSAIAATTEVHDLGSRKVHGGPLKGAPWPTASLLYLATTCAWRRSHMSSSLHPRSPMQPVSLLDEGGSS